MEGSQKPDILKAALKYEFKNKKKKKIKKKIFFYFFMNNRSYLHFDDFGQLCSRK